MSSFLFQWIAPALAILIAVATVAQFIQRRKEREALESSPPVPAPAMLAEWHVIRPNLLRAFFRVLLNCLMFIPLFALFDRFTEGAWKSVSYYGSLIVPIAIFSVIVCVMFVPRNFEWSTDGLRIRTRFSPLHVLHWSTLVAYGDGRGVFLLQFAGLQTFQISSSGFDVDEWKAFLNFLTQAYPDKKGSLWIGSKVMRWRK